MSAKNPTVSATPHSPPLQRIAITGGIGSGKSLVVKLFNEMGIPSLDADAVARKLREPGQPAHQKILDRFGTDDRQALRSILSQDPQAKRDLEAILHPLIHTASEAEMARIAAIEAAKAPADRAPFLLYEAALIIEAGRAKDFDGLIVVTAPDALKIQRIQTRDGMTAEAAEAMVKAQITDLERLKHATWTIENTGTPDQLRQSVRKLLDQLKQA
jgi:dephospho-CoA kinase